MPPQQSELSAASRLISAGQRTPDSRRMCVAIQLQHVTYIKHLGFELIERPVQPVIFWREAGINLTPPEDVEGLKLGLNYGLGLVKDIMKPKSCGHYRLLVVTVSAAGRMRLPEDTLRAKGFELFCGDRLE